MSECPVSIPEKSAVGSMPVDHPVHDLQLTRRSPHHDIQCPRAFLARIADRGAEHGGGSTEDPELEIFLTAT